ncbi:MAG TPA: ribosome silencing factor [Thermoflexus sp.]|nr:ribosome silencing factor [Thermoflexus sp.]
MWDPKHLSDTHPSGGESLDTLDLAHRIVDAILDKKGMDVVLMDIRTRATFADYFIICTGTSERQLKAIMEGIAEATARGYRVDPARVEGDPASGWVLMDYGDIIVHIFSPSQRRYYSLESLWRGAPILVRAQ